MPNEKSTTKRIDPDPIAIGALLMATLGVILQLSPMGNRIPACSQFISQRWGEVDRFVLFHFGTYAFTQSEQYALHGAGNNFKRP
jgi:hypothetical protein